MSVVLKADNVGKKFSRTLRQMMFYGAADMLAGACGSFPDSSTLRPGEFWAVNDVSFELNRGESLGIIGPNGSGKTTLLRMLNGIFMPDAGRIEVKGKVGGLIHVGAGFHPMLTGRENIYINGSILGMTKKEIDRKFDQIVDFADIGDFLDSPVRQYSSGMYVRLGFAVAVHSAPDILLIDEVLAVGDRDFSLKCYQKMQEIRDQGSTTVLVSHNEYVIRERSRRALYLRAGKTAFIGPSDEAIRLYIKDDLQLKAQRGRDPEKDATLKFGTRKAEITGFRFSDPQGHEVTSVPTGGRLQAEIRYRAFDTVLSPVFSVNFYTDNGLVYGANNEYENVVLPDLCIGTGVLHLTLPQFHLPTDTYYVSVMIAEHTAGDLVDCQHFAYTLVVERAANARGSLKLPTAWALKPEGAA